MNIKFNIKDRRYQLTSDRRQFILNEELKSINKTTGKNNTESIGFYPNIEFLLEDLFGGCNAV